MSNEKILTRVQKLLNLADTTKNPSAEEAKAAMMMAQKLMAEHNISMGMVAQSVDKEEVVVRNQTKIREILWWKKELASIIAVNFRCETTTSLGIGINFYGLEEDVELCQVIFAYAMTTIIYLSKKYIQDTVEKGQRIYAVPKKNGYIRGFLRGLQEGFDSQRTGSMALVLQRSPKIDEFMCGKKLKAPKPTREVTQYHHGAIQQGYEDGESFDYTSKAFTGSEG